MTTTVTDNNNFYKDYVQKTGWSNQDIIANVFKIDVPHALANICTLQNNT